MKKIIYSFLSFALIVTILPISSFAATNQNENNSSITPGVAKAIESAVVEFDLDSQETRVEEKVYDNSGNVLGTLGVEKVSTKNINGFNEMVPFGTTTLTPGYQYTFKVYWNSVLVNYHFYTDVIIDGSTRFGEIRRAYDPWKLTFGNTVNSESLSIINKYENSSRAAEARYTLNISTGSIFSSTVWIYGQIRNGKFITGKN